MELGFVGLGKMGQGMVTQLTKKGHTVLAFDASKEAMKQVAAQGVKTSANLESLTRILKPPRAIWVMVPAGKPVDSVIFDGLLPYLEVGDLIVDGGNSNYKHSIGRSQRLKEHGIDFLDIGTSGGLRGVEVGLCFMVGGTVASFKRIEPVLKTLAMREGYGYVGPSGAGHFVKMVHNGVEYALLQSYAEGFELLRNGPFKLDLAQTARIWNNGSIIRSWLLELAQSVLERDAALEEVASEVGGGETGRWAVESALEAGVSFPMASLALFERYRGRKGSFAAKLVAALRHEFGGHPLKTRQK